MAKSRMTWMISPTKAKTNAAVSDSLKAEVEKKAAALIENVLKPKYVLPPKANEQFNYITDIGTKWYRNSLHFIATYACPGPTALVPSFEAKFARMEHLGSGKFTLSFMRHNGQWVGLYDGLTVDECLKAIRDDDWFAF